MSALPAAAQEQPAPTQPAPAQPIATPTPAPVVPLASLTRNALGKVVLAAEGRSLPLLAGWFNRKPDNLELGRACGLNTVIRAITVRNPELALNEALEALAAAEAADLYLILELRPYVARGDAAIAVEDALKNFPTLIGPLVKKLAASNRVVAWAVDYRELAYLPPTPKEFRGWVLANYADLAQVNQAWGTALTNFDTLTISDALNVPLPNFHAPGYAWLDPNLAWAQAHEDRLLALLAAVKQHDPLRPLLVDVPADPYVALVVPPAYLGMFVSAFVEQAEGKSALSLPALAACMRANRFACFPLYASDMGREDRLRAPGMKLKQFVQRAALRGTSGVVIPQQFLPSKPLDAVELEAALAEGKRLTACFVQPALTPVLVTHFPKYFSLGAAYQQFFDDDWTCASDFSEGTPFASCDVVSSRDLWEFVNLDNYSLCLLPAQFELPEEATAALGDFVAGGGALVADLGFACDRAEGHISSMPEDVKLLLGLPMLAEELGGQGELAVHTQISALPAFRTGETTNSALSGLPFGDRWVMAFPGNQTHVFMLWRGMRSRLLNIPVYAGIFARPIESGWAFFASTSLWARWSSEDLAWSKFHLPLAMERAQAALMPVTPDRLPGREGARIAAFPQFVVAQSGDEGKLPLEVEVHHLGGAVFQEAICQVFAPTLGLASNTVRLFGAASADPQLLTPLALQATPSANQVWLQAREVLPDRLELDAFGPGAGLQQTDAGEQLVGPAGQVEVAFTLSDGLYRVQPGSSHILGIRDNVGGTRVMPLTADEQGRLRFALSVSETRLVLIPAEKLRPGATTPDLD